MKKKKLKSKKVAITMPELRRALLEDERIDQALAIVKVGYEQKAEPRKVMRQAIGCFILGVFGVYGFEPGDPADHLKDSYIP